MIGGEVLSYELFAIIGIIICLFILAFEYLWLYVLAVKQEKNTKKYTLAEKNCKQIVDAIMYSPTTRSRKNEIDSLQKIAKGDNKILDMIYDFVGEWKVKNDGEFYSLHSEVFKEIDDALKPIQVYADILKNGKIPDRCYACRRLADFNAVDYINDIGKLCEDKNRSLAYNAAMALSAFGDEQRVAKYVVSIEDDRKFSARIVYELISSFTGDLVDLVLLILKNCNEEMKATVITAVAPYALDEFADIYVSGSRSTSDNMKIACVKALAGLKNPIYEHDLIVAAKDKNWVVRISAIKGLSYFQTNEAIENVKTATKDKEWWVRQVAASSLINMSVKIKDIDEIMKGYDRYAADAVKNSLYREIDIRE